MKKTKEHLDIDMDFLDKEEPLRVAPKSSADSSLPAKPRYNWKNILIIGGVILFFIWIGSQSDSTSTSTSTSNTTATPSSTSTGSSNSSGSTNQSPTKTGTVSVGEYSCSSSLAGELNRQEAEINRLKTEIDSSYVNEYSSQSLINQYNAKIDRYNALTTTYNNYLKTKCTPR